MSTGSNNEEMKDGKEMFEIKENQEKESKQSEESSLMSNNNNKNNSLKEDLNVKTEENSSSNESMEENEEEEDELQEELFEAFNTLDEDHTGLITKEELFNFMRKIGHTPSDLELREIMGIVAKEHPSGITFDDFVYILDKQVRDEFNVNSIKDAFRVFDKVMKGKIKKEDLKNLLLNRGEQNMTEEEIQDLIDHYVDYDENGEVNYNDFVNNTFELFK